MENFDEKYAKLFKALGESKSMVLSTSLNDHVTSRTMSILMIEQQLYFQTDKLSKKYEQLHKNPHVSLCMDHIQIEGKCAEIGAPTEHPVFCELYKQHFPFAFDLYSHLPNERLFCVTPLYIKTWIYIDGHPFEELFSVAEKKYVLREYM